ncbi:MAG: hypothetical protein AAGF60_08490 [Pseudomonadota bacterium]
MGAWLRELALWVGLIGGLLSLLFALPSYAQERMTPEAFLSAVDGKTIRFEDLNTRSTVGIERFLSPELSVWRGREGICVYGEITTPNGQVCFLYRELNTAPVCWYPFSRDGALFVLHADRIGSEIQRATEVDPSALQCNDAPTS